MKTDNYLTLCLEQAAKSPLHYRHGCIIVRGGKVIGHGYNDYRPGFNGGALKHGRIAKSILDGPAIANLKEKLKKQKQKPEPKPKQNPQNGQPDSSKTFIPFESAMDGHHANTPLSMHILKPKHDYDAKSSPPTSRPSARPAKAPACRRFKSAVLKLPHLNQVLHHKGHDNNDKRKEDQEDVEDKEEREKPLPRLLKEDCRAFHEQLGGEKHHQKKKKEKKKKNQKEGYQYEYQYGRYGQQTHLQQLPSASKKNSPPLLRPYDDTSTWDVNETTTAVPASNQHAKHKKDYKRSGKMKPSGSNESSPQGLLLLPKSHAGENGATLNDRKKHPRLSGADLYVTRLGSCGAATAKSSVPNSAITALRTTAEDLTASSEGSLLSSNSSLPTISSTTSTGSLHEALQNRVPNPGPSTPPADSNEVDRTTVRASRPCYRCITYMHSVGIKRVFWTNDDGEWEGGKVRDLVDALDSSMESVAKGGPMGNGIFVTKHEVLMLKRMMGGVVGS